MSLCVFWGPSQQSLLVIKALSDSSRVLVHSKNSLLSLFRSGVVRIVSILTSCGGAFLI